MCTRVWEMDLHFTQSGESSDSIFNYWHIIRDHDINSLSYRLCDQIQANVSSFDSYTLAIYT